MDAVSAPVGPPLLRAVCGAGVALSGLSPWLALLPSAAGMVFYALFGHTGNDPVVCAWAMMGLDIATGLLKGSIHQRLSSRIATAGLARKVAMICAIVTGHVADRALGTGDLMKAGLGDYCIGIEFLSVTENLSAVGLALPAPLIRATMALMANAETTSVSLAETEATRGKRP